MSAAYLYVVYGVTIESEFAFPELAPGSGAPDLRVRRGVGDESAAAMRTGTFFEARRDGFLLRVEGIGRVWASAARDVVVDVEPAASDAVVRTLLLGLVLTAVLHQRGVLVLHASSVVTRHGAVLLAGHSGDGKSTLLAALVGRGYEPFGDDAAVITQEGTGRLLAHPGFPYVKLWEDAAIRLGHAFEDAPRVTPGVDKYSFRLGACQTRPPEALAGLCLLGFHDGDNDIRCESVVGREYFAAVREYTRNFSLLEELRMQVPHFHLAAAVASGVPAVRITRPRDGDSLQEVLDRLEPYLHGER